MKRFFALVALVLGLASCQTEPEGLDVQMGGAVDATITVNIPDSETRAGGSNSAGSIFDNVNLGTEDDTNTMRYILMIYDAEGNASKDRQVAYSDGKTVNFDVRLVPGRHYSFVVWADYVTSKDDIDNHYNTKDGLTNITLKADTWVAMDETRDAFTGVFNTAEDGNGGTYNGAKDINITLTRPFAKLRVITTDIKELDDLHITPAYATVEYTTEYRPAFDALAGTAKAVGTDKKAHSTVFPIAPYTNEANDKHNRTIFTDYFFANEGDAVSFILNVYEDAAKTKPIKSNNFSTDIAVNRNYLTTISGNILTDGNNVKVDIIDAFDGETEWPDENKSAEQLAYAAMFGGEVTLTENITLTQPLTIVEGANVVINLNGKTISNPNDYAIENYGTLTIDGDGNINGLGNIRSHAGNVTINGGTFTGSSDWNNGTYQHILKAVNTEVVINGGTFDATIQGMTNAMINVSENSVVTINGGEFRNVVDGEVIPQFAPYMFTYEKNGKLIINDGDFYGGWRFNGETTTTDIYGGNFTVSYDGQSFHASSTHVLTVYGGVFDLNNGGKLNPTSHCATGYKAIAADGIYYVLSEFIANAAEAEGVTAVTESTADVATALATNNGEATLFMWNDVAYIAKYGEVVITSDVDEATTVRGVVESSAGLTSATVADGIEVVGNRTFRKCANLETVALPNTLTEIGPAVFQSCSKLANITIPESVTTIGEGAFAECTALTSINIPYGVTRLEKDVLRNTGLVSVEIPASVNYIGTYAFRDCESLTEVRILSPEFTIENNTFTNMAAPVPTMTIYVENAEMKAYLESTLSNYDKTYITVVGPTSVSNAEELEAAIINGGNILLAEGTYDIPVEAQGKTLKFIGASDDPTKTVIAANTSGSYEGCNYNLSGSTVVFENITITTDNLTYTGYASCNATFNNCIINNCLTLYGDMVFNNCVFNVSGDQYNIWTWAAPTATFNGCTFNSDGKAVLLYGGGNTTMTVNNCTFNDTGVLTDMKAAIEIGSDYGTSCFELIVNNTVVNGYEINDKGINTGTTLWGNKNSMGQDKLNVVVDGVDVY